MNRIGRRFRQIPALFELSRSVGATFGNDRQTFGNR
jgi:hypothetical protein